MGSFRPALSLGASLAILLLFTAWSTGRADEPDQTAQRQTSGDKSKGGAASDKQPTATDSPSAEDVPATRTFEKVVDGYAGWCVGKLASVIFYEIGKRTDTVETQSVPSDVDAIGKLVASLAEQGVNLNEVDFALSVPTGSLSETAAKDLAKACKKKFSGGQRRSFKVTVRTDSDDGQGTTLTAVRHGAPFIVVWLALGAIFFTVRMGFINIRGFKHAVLVTSGRYDDPKDTGEVTHFQALSAALSATVGLGNIAGVAIAVMSGGPGATFWMIIAGFLGMSAKFTECTLGQMYRTVRPDGRIMGGAMFYLSNGLRELKVGQVGLGGLGRILGGLFAILCVFASFGGGNAFQVNQSLRALEATMPLLKDYHWVYGLVMMFLVGIVILGGIRRIAATAEKIVPLMCGLYVVACLWILLTNLSALPEAFTRIVTEAFTPRAGYGALVGVLIMGFKRAAFSNEAGVGSAAIAHSAAKTDYPVREGIVASLGPFIDTVIICTMTALVIVITGAYNNPDYAHFVAENNGAGLTSRALGEQVAWFPYVLSAAVLLFAYSTMISWSYYGERCWAYLFGDRSTLVYRIAFLVFIVLGSVMSATNVLDLSDLMILGMAFPNILGAALLSGKVKRALNEYWKRHRAGEFEQNASTDN